MRRSALARAFQWPLLAPSRAALASQPRACAIPPASSSIAWSMANAVMWRLLKSPMKRQVAFNYI